MFRPGMTITITVPFGTPERVPVWAEEESEIDWRADGERAARSTLSFAALELERHLRRTIPGLEVRYASAGAAGLLRIELRIDARGRAPGSYTLEPAASGLSVTGEDRVGVLYGAYELLRMQGWRWYAPGAAGEVAPDPSGLRLPEKRLDHSPAFDLYRGFDSAYASQDSAELLVWMARNRLNLSSHRELTGPLGRKLGMIYKNGGHIFEPILDPDRVLPSGRTLWEEHRRWYGLPASGERVKENALRTQFCVSQPDLLEYLARELLGRIRGEWLEADLVAVWGFDTWGSSCTCPDCRNLGNDTDQMLHLLSALRGAIDAARGRGEITHDVRMAGCAYEGTSTLAGPGRPIPANLLDAGDCIIFYPIDRSYAEDFQDPGSDTNRPYAAALASWLGGARALPIMLGEYYNVSKFEDLPLVFTTRITNDLPSYRRSGARAITYMHLPQLCWALRTLNQGLYALLAYDAEADSSAYVEQYFRGWYGPHADLMRAAYELIESAWAHAAEWRAWHRSVLDLLLKWDGARPELALTPANRLATAGGATSDGRRAIRLLTEALRTVERAQQSERERAAALADLSGLAYARAVQYERRLGEDRRLVRYGLDTMRLMTETVAYHDALRRTDGKAADKAWGEIESIAAEMDSYWVPIDYEWPGPGLGCRDALSRTQLRELIGRCRRARRRSKR